MRGNFFMTPKLTIELVPKHAWFSNLRSNLSREQWDVVRKAVYLKAGFKCEICGGHGERNRIEAHEIWSYHSIDGRNIQRLERVAGLCPRCHQVKHIGLAEISGRGDSCREQLAKVNEWDMGQVEAYVQEQFRLWEERSELEWELDVTWLESNFNYTMPKKRPCREPGGKVRRLSATDALKCFFMGIGI